MAQLVNAGHDPRTIAEEFVRHLRDGFLALMAPELVQLPSADVDALASQSQRLGAPRLVAAIEHLGEVLVELRHAPDPRVLIEVALVQLSRADSGASDPGDIEALTARIAKLERIVAAGGAAASAAAPAPIDPDTGRTKLGGRAERAVAAAAPARPPTSPSTPATAAPPADSAPPEASAPPGPSLAPGDPASEWVTEVRPSLKGLARPLFAPVELVSAVDDRVVLAAPNEAHRARCEPHVATVQQRWKEACGRAVTITWGTETDAAPAASAHIDPGADDELSAIDEDAPVITGSLSVVERVAKAFPGAQRLEQDS